MTDVYQALLGMMAGGQQAASARSALMESLSAQDGIDPLTRALLSQAMGPEGGDEARADDAVPEGEEDDDQAGGDEEPGSEYRALRRRRALRRLRKRFVSMQAEIEDLRERNERLAAALAARKREEERRERLRIRRIVR